MPKTTVPLAQSAGSLPTAVKTKKRIDDGWILFMLSIPFVIFIFIFSYVPIAGWIYAFFDYTPGLPLLSSPFVGFKYFAMMFKEWSQTGVVLRNTLVLSFLNLLVTPLPVLFAVMINETKSKYFRKIIQTTTTLPNFISWIILYSIFYSLFSMEGVVNQLFVQIGIFAQPENILGNPDIAWFLQVGLNIWKGLGWGSIIYLAAITGIDQELYDAAKVDGAGRFQSIRHITIPGISSTYLVMLLLAVSNILSNGFDQYFVFNNALVTDRLMVLDLYVYNMGIIYSQYSYSVAIGILKTVVGIALLMTANLVSKRIRGSSIF